MERDDFDKIVSIVEHELDETPRSIAALEEGLLHETYEIQCDTGEYIVQFASDIDKDRRDSLHRGLSWYLVLQNSQIPVPDVVTETIREINGRRYVLVEKLPGTTGEQDISPNRVRNAGRYLARIHNSRRFETAGWMRFGDRRVSVEPFQEGSLKQWLQRTVTERTNELKNGGMALVGVAVERVFDQRGEVLPDEFQPVLCHDDFSPDNILFQGDTVTGILDFDRTYVGLDQRELVKAANGFWMHDPCTDWNVRATLYEGYSEVRALSPSFKHYEPLYRVETLAGIIAGLHTMGELSEYEQGFYAERILEAVERVKD